MKTNLEEAQLETLEITIDGVKQTAWIVETAEDIDALFDAIIAEDTDEEE